MFWVLRTDHQPPTLMEASQADGRFDKTLFKPSIQFQNTGYRWLCAITKGASYREQTSNAGY